MEYIDEKLVKEGCECAHRDTRVMRDDVSQSLEEGQRRREKRTDVEDVRFHKELVACNRTVGDDGGVVMRNTRPPL